MASLPQRLRAASAALFGRGASSTVLALRSPKAPQGASFAPGLNGSATWGVYGPRRAARSLIRFAEKNVWVRTAISLRKQAISQAKWAVVRLDDPKAQPDDAVLTAAQELFTFVNDKGESLGTLLAMMVEDLLIIDAGCCEIEKKANGKIAALWAVPGEEIAPDPKWDGSKPKQSRYFQYRDGKLIGQYRNDELVYMMGNPRSRSCLGLSPLETLFDTVEADLYGEGFEFGRMKETAPSGILDLGDGWPPEKVEAFRDQWETDIAANRDVAIIGSAGASMDGESSTRSPVFIPFSRSARDEMRREYMLWLAKKIAAAFQIDLLAFNLSEAIHRSVGTNMQAKTDAGLISLANVVQSYITREIMWVLDPSHRHGFVFQELTPRDAKAEADIRAIYMNIGCTTPNEIRAEEGKDPVPWGDEPWPTALAKAVDPAQEDKPPDDETKSKSVECDGCHTQYRSEDRVPHCPTCGLANP